MLANKRCGIDRRSTGERRRQNNLDYFLNGGVERRSARERRSRVERRVGWVRLTEWSSLFAANLYKRA